MTTLVVPGPAVAGPAPLLEAELDLLDPEVPAAGTPTAASTRPGTHREALEPDRLRRAKRAYTTRFLGERVGRQAKGLHLLSGTEVHPQVGAVALARVVAIGQHKAIPGPHGRRQTLFPGDEVLVAYAHRYAPDQFEAFVPEHLTITHLVAAGGLVAEVNEAHARVKDATVLEPLGLLADEEGLVTLERLATHRVTPVEGDLPDQPRVVAVLGSSMNSGKTTTLANLVNGLARAGLRVHAGKATGTGAWGDPGLFRDAGAAEVLDFTNFGHASTYRLPAEHVHDLFASLRSALSQGDPDVVVIEIADGLYQDETSALVADPRLAGMVHTVVFAAGEALGAVAGVRHLQSHQLPVSAVSGCVTSSPLASRESESVLDVPVVDTFALSDPEVACRVAGLTA